MDASNGTQRIEEAAARVAAVEDEAVRSILEDQIEAARYLQERIAGRASAAESVDLDAASRSGAAEAGARSSGVDPDTLIRTLEPVELEALLGSIAEQCVAIGAQDHEETVRLDVRSFGAEGDGDHDDGPAFLAAFAALKSLPGRGVLHIPAGTYRLSSFTDSERRTFLDINGLRDVQIEGDGPLASILVGTGIGSVLRMENCERVRVARIGFDFDPLPFTQGRVSAVDNESRSLDWEPDEGWPAFGEWLPEVPFDPTVRIPFGSGTVRDGKTGAFVPDGNFPFSRIEDLGAGRTRLFLRVPWWRDDIDFPKIAPGDRMTLHSRSVPGKQCALWIAANRHCEFREVGVYASWHHAILVSDNDAVRFIRCTCEPKPDTDRLGVSNADGFHIRNNRIGPHLFGCRVTGTNDDTSNFYSRAVSLLTQRSRSRLVIDAPFHPAHRATDWQTDSRSFRVGDHVAAIHPLTGSIDAFAVVTQVSATMWRGYPRIELALSLEVAELISRERLGKEHPVTHNMEFFHIGPEEIAEHMIVNLRMKSDGFVLRDNTFGRNHVNTIKLKGSNGIIEGNRFDRPTSLGITLCMRLTWQEAFPPRNVAIRRNTFVGCNGIDATIDYPGGRRHHGPAYIDGITLAENRFEEVPAFGVRLANVRTMRVIDNEFASDHPIELSVHSSSKCVEFSGNRVNGRLLTAEDVSAPAGSAARLSTGGEASEAASLKSREDGFVIETRRSDTGQSDRDE